MYHFFAEHENIFDDYIDIKGGDVNHIKNVLRLKKGDEILISSGDNYDYNCIIDTITDDYVRSLITSVNEKGNELSSKVYLFQGLPKADKMELIIQKMIELGVYEIVPVAMKRSVVKLDDKKAKSKVARWNTIAESAAKQSKRSIMPKVSDVVSFKQAVAMASELDVLLLPYECAEGIEHTRQVIASIGKGKSIGIFIGPEGGFDKDELELATNAYVQYGGIIMQAYLDNSATTKCAPEVVDVCVKVMSEDYGNPSSKHMKGVEAENYIKEAKETIAKTLKCQEKEILFTSGGTESNNMAIIGTAMANKRKGNHVIVSSVEQLWTLMTLRKR